MNFLYIYRIIILGAFFTPFCHYSAHELTLSSAFIYFEYSCSWFDCALDAREPAERCHLFIREHGTLYKLPNSHCYSYSVRFVSFSSSSCLTCSRQISSSGNQKKRIRSLRCLRIIYRMLVNYQYLDLGYRCRGALVQRIVCHCGAFSRRLRIVYVLSPIDMLGYT
jgi:hypothetical protein